MESDRIPWMDKDVLECDRNPTVLRDAPLRNQYPKFLSENYITV